MQLITIYILASCLLIGLAEYCIHRWTQHRINRFANWLLDEPVAKLHGLHHANRDNSSARIDMDTRLTLIISIPVWLGALPFDWRLSLTWVLACLAHSALWSAVHRAAHSLGFGWIRATTFGRWLIRHHERHHERADKNFGATFGIFWDLVFGTLSLR